MKTRAFALFIILVLGIFLMTFQAFGQSGGFIISGADAVVYLDQADSPTLDNLIALVAQRFVVRYANRMKYLDLVPIPSTLRDLFLQVKDRFIFQYANANRFIDLNYPANLVGDTDPPAIQNLAVNSSGLVSWDTDEYADGELFWGEQSGNYTLAISNTLYSLSHQLQMSGITPGKIYYYIVASSDRSGNTAQSQEHTFVIDAPISGLHPTNDSPTRLGSKTTFTANVVTGSNVTYTWDFGDGETGSGAQVMHEYAVPGEYTATVTASNSRNSQSSPTEVIIFLNQYLPLIVH